MKERFADFGLSLLLVRAKCRCEALAWFEIPPKQSAGRGVKFPGLVKNSGLVFFSPLHSSRPGSAPPLPASSAASHLDRRRSALPPPARSVAPHLFSPLALLHQVSCRGRWAAECRWAGAVARQVGPRAGNLTDRIFYCIAGT